MVTRRLTRPQQVLSVSVAYRSLFLLIPRLHRYDTWAPKCIIFPPLASYAQLSHYGWVAFKVGTGRHYKRKRRMWPSFLS